MTIPTTVGPRFAGNTSDMDRDLVVLIKTEEPNIPHVFVEKSVLGSEVALRSFVPEFQLKEYQVEAIFLVDCSGSMDGISMDLAKESLQVFIHSLPLNSFRVCLLLTCGRKGCSGELHCRAGNSTRTGRKSVG